ncbi:MAG: SDR family oxidoreductase [Gaiellaceae bacterium]
MTSLEGGVALVTGASSGIGAATAEVLTTEGMTVHALARRSERLQRLATQLGCTTHTLDVRDADALAELVTSIGPIDVLINNAGLGRAGGSLATATLDDVERSVDTNVTAAINLVRLCLPNMIERGRGHIVNVGSMVGLYPVASALYGATKGAMHLLSLDLRLELQGTGVKVSEICAGRVDTEFYDVAIDDPERAAQVKDSGIEEVTADDVADTIAYALKVPWRVNINRIELQPTEQTYGGVEFVPRTEVT